MILRYFKDNSWFIVVIHLKNQNGPANTFYEISAEVSRTFHGIPNIWALQPNGRNENLVWKFLDSSHFQYGVIRSYGNGHSSRPKIANSMFIRHGETMLLMKTQSLPAGLSRLYNNNYISVYLFHDSLVNVQLAAHNPSSRHMIADWVWICRTYWPISFKMHYHFHPLRPLLLRTSTKISL